MRKKFVNIAILVCTTIIAALGFSSCGTQKEALAEKQRQERLEQEARDKAAREEQAARAEQQRRMIEESERRRRELEQQKLVYGPPTRDFRPNISK